MILLGLIARKKTKNKKKLHQAQVNLHKLFQFSINFCKELVKKTTILTGSSQNPDDELKLQMKILVMGAKIKSD